MNSDGGNPLQLTTAENAIDTQLQVTKDGKNVIFMRQTSDGGRTKLLRVSIDGGESVPIMPDDPMSEFFPRLSSDGKLTCVSHF